ncbi:alpha/beta fold hydrolase [Flammeovirga pectinis]|uniref:Alpha/beta fold hydrolase n=1 Tax=Flammeovirga pectinis TaxID=2494373 RepID=A0A3Q9FNS5_9BACT|nr:alpha/beta fold hydrolase [Flammeovirga pectinis]AZQ62480.1 alpha/beta fold hydrolase [Flammeovirga pectinis]
MPLLKSIKLKTPFWHFNGHLQTILPSLQRNIDDVEYKRERITTPDKDFLDFDWSCQNNKRIVIISHGLEGGADRHYCKGIAKLFNNNNWDALAWNCRSCSGELNKLPRFYHHGDVEDFKLVVDKAIERGYQEIALVGFSMGGAISMNALGTKKFPTQKIIGAVAVSTPIDLISSSDELEKKSKSFYNQKFFKKLKKKVIAKSKYIPELDASPLLNEQIKSLRGFDENYTAPLHGFKNAHDFYYNASVERRMDKIEKPVLILNAKNDPFLTEKSYPIEFVKTCDNIYLEMPKNGGHVGFCIVNSQFTYAEIRSLEFLNAQSSL